VNASINRITSYLEAKKVDVEELLETVKEEYGKGGPSSLESLEEPMRSGYELHTLNIYAQQLEKAIKGKKAMYKLLAEGVANEQKISIFNAIKENVKNEPSLVNEIDRRIKILNEDTVRKMAKGSSKVEEEGKAIKMQVEKTKEDNPLLNKVLEDTKEPEGTAGTETETKQASYKNNPDFNLSILYGDVMQARIASLAARAMISARVRQEA